MKIAAGIGAKLVEEQAGLRGFQPMDLVNTTNGRRLAPDFHSEDGDSPPASKPWSRNAEKFAETHA